MDDYSKIKIAHAILILEEIASCQDNVKYHLKWISKLDKSSCEALYTDIIDKCPNSWRIYDNRLRYLLN